MPFEEHYIRVDGIWTRYLSAGSGPPVILLHALGENALDWQWVISRLADRYQVYAPDFPGYVDGNEDGLPRTSTAYAGFMTALMKKLDIPRAVLAGNSLGGLIAIRMTLSDPDRVSALVLVSSAGLGKEITPFFAPLITPVAGDLASEWSATAFGARIRAQFRSLLLFARPERTPDEWLSEQCRLSRIPGYRSVTLELLRAHVDYLGQREIVRDQLPQIKVPTLVIWGERDQVIPVAHARESVKKLRHGTLEVFPHLSHLPHVEDPARFSAALREFLRNLH